MDVRQFDKAHKGAVSKKASSQGIKTFSAGFSASQAPMNKKKVHFGIWNDQTNSQLGKEKAFLERKQEQKRRIAIEAIKLAEQRKQAMLKRSETQENDVPCVKLEQKMSTRRALFSLDVNKPVIVPAVKEVKFGEKPKGRPILKTKQFSDLSLPTDLMKDMYLEDLPKPKKIVRYTIEELKNMNPQK